MRRALLDVNVLLALIDPQHVQRDRALTWLDEQIDSGWASCPITENGFVRVISQPRYPNAVPPLQAAGRLAEATGTTFHEFWPCDISLLDGALVEADRLHGPKQITDAYLLALAVSRGGRLVTFDRSVALSAVPGASPDCLVVL